MKLEGTLKCYAYCSLYGFQINITGAFGVFEVTHDISKYCKAKMFSEIGKKTPMMARFSTVGKIQT